MQLRGTMKNKLPYGLTDRQLHVLQLMFKGCKASEVAKKFKVETRTIQFHLGVIYSKLDVHNICQAIYKCLQEGILEPPKKTL